MPQSGMPQSGMPQSGKRHAGRVVQPVTVQLRARGVGAKTWSSPPGVAPRQTGQHAHHTHEHRQFVSQSLCHAVTTGDNRRATTQRARNQRPCAREPAGASTATATRTDIRYTAAQRMQPPARFELGQHCAGCRTRSLCSLPLGQRTAPAGLHDCAPRAPGQHAQAGARALTALPGQRAAPAGLPHGAPRALRRRAQAGARAPHAAVPWGGARRLRGRAAARARRARAARAG